MYWKDLSKKEKKHLRDFDITTLRDFKEMAINQAKDRERAKPALMEPCWDCRAIAKKLGLPV